MAVLYGLAFADAWVHDRFWHIKGMSSPGPRLTRASFKTRVTFTAFAVLWQVAAHIKGGDEPGRADAAAARPLTFLKVPDSICAELLPDPSQMGRHGRVCTPAQTQHVEFASLSVDTNGDKRLAS